MRFFSPRLPSEMQWLKSFQVLVGQWLIAFHFGKAANSRACGRQVDEILSPAAPAALDIPTHLRVSSEDWGDTDVRRPPRRNPLAHRPALGLSRPPPAPGASHSGRPGPPRLTGRHADRRRQVAL